MVQGMCSCDFRVQGVLGGLGFRAWGLGSSCRGSVFSGSPVVPLCLFVGSRLSSKGANPKKGALIVIWLLGY